MSKPKPSDLELQVLAVLWERGPSTVRDLLDVMPDGKRRAYTTMLSVVQVMEKKGLLSHDRKGLAHVYRPAVEKRRVLAPMLRELVRNVFGGSAARAMQALMSAGDVEKADLAEIRDVIGRMEAEDKRAAGKGRGR